MDDEDPDKLRPTTTIEILTQSITDAQGQISARTGYRGRDTYPLLAICYIQLRAHGLEYEDRLEEFEVAEQSLDKKYGGTLTARKYYISWDEADERFKNILVFWRDIGAGWIDKDNYYTDMSPDTINFAGWTDK